MSLGGATIEETSELLQMPLSADEHEGEEGSSNRSSGSTRIGGNGWACGTDWIIPTIFDASASTVFWFVIIFVEIPSVAVYCLLAGLLASMIAWRFYVAKSIVDAGGSAAALPYTCGYATSGDKELFLVATVHISPRAPRDVEAVIDQTRPDITLIELDDERLDRMRDPEEQRDRARAQPKREDLQQIRITAEDLQGQPLICFAQRALWNGEWSGDAVAGQVFFDESDPYGLSPTTSGTTPSGSHLALVTRGGPDGTFAPFALKAHNAVQKGALALLVIDQEPELPINRIGGGTLTGELRIAMKTWSCGFPPVPTLLLPRDQGETLRELCLKSKQSVVAASVAEANKMASPWAEFQIMPDSYPRRTLRRRLCNACALLFSGIGVLYGIVQCFGVEVGAEFTVAETASNARGIPCKCIDVNLNAFWSRVGAALVPHPYNIARSLLSWLALPRALFQVLFPKRGNVDVLGSTVLHGASFPLRTWFAFILAGLCASQIMSHVMALFSFGAEQAAEGAGVVSKESRDDVQAYILLGLQMYMLPRLFDSVATSRDEAMYRSIVAKSKLHGARKLVVVVGAAHSNGILQRVRDRGL